MRYSLIPGLLCVIIFVSGIAQTNEMPSANTPAMISTVASSGETTASTVKPSPTYPGVTSLQPRRIYPIAAGVWYPGQPLPEKPFRYYRVRCWPGCHHASPYGKYPGTAATPHPNPTTAPEMTPSATIDVK